MDWVFIVFGVGTIAYAFSIVKDHMLDARIQATLRQTLMAEREMLATQIDDQQGEQESVRGKIQEAKKTTKEYEDLARKREAEIKQFEESMAKRGKYRV